jgi:anti-anti-sigma regulatory factor
MIAETPFEQKWILQGRLCGQWAADLKAKWDASRNARAGRKVVIDLENVLRVDQTGEQALLGMAAEGARLISSRAYMRHILGGLHVDY